jgi:hypothetical protein
LKLSFKEIISGFGLKKKPEIIKNKGIWKEKMKFLTNDGIGLCPIIIKIIPNPFIISKISSLFSLIEL